MEKRTCETDEFLDWSNTIYEDGDCDCECDKVGLHVSPFTSGNVIFIVFLWQQWASKG